MEKRVPQSGSFRQVASQSPQSDIQFLRDLYQQMLRIRRFEEAAFQQYQKGNIVGFCHLYSGQEAVAVGAVSCMKKGDKVVTAYRDHGHALALGMSMESVMAELFGKATGCCKGKGGSMHLFSPEHGLYGGNGIVGSHVPVAVGVAFAQKYTSDGGVTLCFFGDGAAQQGAVHEAMNLAGLWRVPVVFIIENNLYGMGTSVERASAIKELHQRAAGYNFAGLSCNGMDVLDVRNKLAPAIESARKEFSPTLIEAKTYRFRGHSMSDPALYRAQDELNEYKHQDPILLLKAELLNNSVDEHELDNLDKSAREEAKASVDFAMRSPEPDTSELAQDVYAQPWDENLLPQVKIEPQGGPHAGT